ncbi:c-type cytochrome biogenesis protein CcmI [Aquabacterium humicola]|uniref:c-type cytochrome biogenesis protein CcmI n=1 Tax=Aquabacterium humicola TaxID=3237377 RepID=UPI00254277CE|nr:c-type cytochrome biogenesis protein CcmI [Rubrivivax pictus]
MGAFLFAAVALITVTLLLLLRPWRRSTARNATSAGALNAAVYRHQLAELERDLAAGTLSEQDGREAREELQRRLLDDTAAAESASPAPGAPAPAAPLPRSALVVALMLPLVATGLYAQLGAPIALLHPSAATAGAPSPHGDGAAPSGMPPDVERMVASLAAKLEKNPGDAAGWAMLARSYHALGRMAEAAAAYERTGDALQRDPSLLAQSADALATLANGSIEGEPLKRVEAALKLDPDHPMALSLAATAAYKRRDFAVATVHWKRLLTLVPPDSDDARWLEARLAEIAANRR